MSDEVSIFESLVRGLNSDQYHVFRSVVDTHHIGEGGLFFPYGSSGIRKLICGIPSYLSFDLTSTLS